MAAHFLSTGTTPIATFSAIGSSLASFTVADGGVMVLNATQWNIDPNSEGYDTSTGKYKVPITGKYYLCWKAYLYSGAGNIYNDTIVENDVDVLTTYRPAVDHFGIDSVHYIHGLASLTQGRYVWCENNSGGARNYYGNVLQQSNFFGFFLGA